MKISFYIKLFIAFFIFAFLLLSFASFSFTTFYKFNNEKKEKENTLSILNHQEKIFKMKLENYSNKLEGCAKKFIANNFDLNDDFKEFKIVELNGQEVYKIKKENGKIIVFEEDKFKNIFTKEYYKNIRVLNDGETYYNYSKDINSSLITIIKREKDRFLILKIDFKDFFKTLFDSFEKKTLVIGNDDSILNLDSKNKSFFIQNNFLDLYLKESLNIKASDFLIDEEFISKKIFINKEQYFIFFINTKNQLTQNLFSEYYESVIVIGLSLAFLLSLLFSLPIARLNKVIEEENEKLDLDNKNNYLQLNENQKVIDKYVMFVRLDKNNIILDISEAFSYFLGFSKSELLGHDFKILVHNDMKKRDFSEIKNQIKEGIFSSKELKGYKKDKEIFFLDLFIEGIFKDNKIEGYSIIALDITNKKKIEELYENINNQVTQYNAIFENVNSGIALIDLEGNFIKVNKPFTKFLSYEEKELLKMTCFSIVSNESKSLLQKLLIGAKEIGNISNIEKIFVSKDNSHIHLELSLSLLGDKKHFLFVVNSLEDKRKLQELNQDLELRISKEVEKSIQKDKIHQQEQIKNAKLTSIGSLAAGIAHEINTPLTYIKGNLELMQYDISDLPPCGIKTQMIEDTSKMKEGLNRIANIVESMREMSQSSKEIKEKINIYATLITSLTMAYNRSKQVSRVYLNQELFNIDSINKNQFEFFCKVQKQRIEQVWIIIINNALDALENIEDYEKRVLNIKIYEDSSDIVIKFMDNANGIKEDMIEDIFEPFISSKEHSGMGVGLNIAKKIIDEQDGIIKAYNENNGAVFEIRLKKYED